MLSYLEGEREHFALPLAKVNLCLLYSLICVARLSFGLPVLFLYRIWPRQVKQEGGIMSVYTTNWLSPVSYLGYFSMTEPDWGPLWWDILCPGHPFCSQQSSNLIKMFVSLNKCIFKILTKDYWDGSFATPRTTIFRLNHFTKNHQHTGYLAISPIY